MSYSKLSFAVASIAFALFSMAVHADVQEQQTTETAVTPPVTTTNLQGQVVTTQTIQRSVITTPVPAAKEIIATPNGYVDCFTVEAAWHNDVWIPEHRVCQYENQAQGDVWIEGYWGCNKATTEGVCTNWEWKSGHWDKKLVVY